MKNKEIGHLFDPNTSLDDLEIKKRTCVPIVFEEYFQYKIVLREISKIEDDDDRNGKDRKRIKKVLNSLIRYYERNYYQNQ
jgi:hypothetical protein